MTGFKCFVTDAICMLIAHAHTRLHTHTCRCPTSSDKIKCAIFAEKKSLTSCMFKQAPKQEWPHGLPSLKMRHNVFLSFSHCFDLQRRHFIVQARVHQGWLQPKLSPMNGTAAVCCSTGHFLTSFAMLHPVGFPSSFCGQLTDKRWNSDLTCVKQLVN